MRLKQRSERYRSHFNYNPEDSKNVDNVDHVKLFKQYVFIFRILLRNLNTIFKIQIWAKIIIKDAL